MITLNDLGLTSILWPDTYKRIAKATCVPCGLPSGQCLNTYYARETRAALDLWQDGCQVVYSPEPFGEDTFYRLIVQGAHIENETRQVGLRKPLLSYDGDGFIKAVLYNRSSGLQAYITLFGHLCLKYEALWRPITLRVNRVNVTLKFGFGFSRLELQTLECKVGEIDLDLIDTVGGTCIVKNDTISRPWVLHSIISNNDKELSCVKQRIHCFTAKTISEQEYPSHQHPTNVEIPTDDENSLFCYAKRKDIIFDLPRFHEQFIQTV